MQHWIQLFILLGFTACYVRGNISDCGLTENAGDWTVSGSCRIQVVNITDDRYACSWSQNTSADAWSTSFIADDPEARVNRSGHCIFTRSLPHDEGVYTYFLHYQPAHDERQIVGNITISPPLTPKTQANWPQNVLEGDTLTCYCNTTDPGSPPSSIRWSGFTSHQLTVHSVTRDMDGEVYNCTQTWNTSVVSFVNYTMRVQHPPSGPVITGYTTNQVLTAGDNVSLTCTVSGGNPPVTNIRLYCLRQNTNVTDEFDSSSSSITVTIDRLRVSDDGTECVCNSTGEWPPDPSLHLEAVTHLNVVVRGNISDCGLTEIAGDWTVSGSCRIQVVNITDDRYACSWSQSTSGDAWATSFIADDPEARVNRSGHCIFTRSLPPDEGVYTYFLHYQPAHDERHIVGNITISPPLTPKTQTNCPQYVVEGDTLTCNCTTTDPGSPPSSARWSGFTSHQLIVHSVIRDMDGAVYNCTQTWNTRVVSFVNYTMRVQHPPSGPIITGYTTNQVLTAGDNVSLTCTVSGGNPPVNNITFYCLRQNTNVTGEFDSSSSSITVTIDRLRVSDDGTECVCNSTGEWPPDPSLHLEAVIHLNLVDKTPRSSKSYIRAYVGGGVVAAAVVVAVAAGVLLYRKYGRDLYDRPQPRQQEPDNYTGLVLYEDIRGSKRDQTVDVTGSEYENTGMNTSRPACITTEVIGDTDDEKPGDGLVDDPSLSGAYERLQVNIQESNNYTELTLKSIQK